MILDDVFEKKDDIAIAVKSELNDAMINYGFDIIKKPLLLILIPMLKLKSL